MKNGPISFVSLTPLMPQVKSSRAMKEKEKKASQRRGSAILIQKALKKNIEKKRESNKQEKKRRDSAVLIAQVRTTSEHLGAVTHVYDIFV